MVQRKTARRHGLVLLDFWQASCAPCLALEPRLEHFAQHHPGTFTGYRIDVDTDQATTADFDVLSIPTLILLREGREVARLDGLVRDAAWRRCWRRTGTAPLDLAPGASF